MARAPALQAGGPGFESPCLHKGEFFEIVKLCNNDEDITEIGKGIEE